MGIEGYDGGDYMAKEAAEFQMNKYESRVGDAASVDSNFGKFEDGGLQRASPFAYGDVRGTGSPYQYGDTPANEMQMQFDRFYAYDQPQGPPDQAVIDGCLDGKVVTVTQDGNRPEVSDPHELLRFAQENNRPYVPVHLYQTKY